MGRFSNSSGTSPCYGCAQLWINPSLRFATEFATQAHVWRSVGARLHLGQLHKLLFDKHKPFIHSSLQTAHSDQISDFRADKSMKPRFLHLTGVLPGTVLTEIFGCRVKAETRFCEQLQGNVSRPKGLVWHDGAVIELLLNLLSAPNRLDGSHRFQYLGPRESTRCRRCR